MMFYEAVITASFSNIESIPALIRKTRDSRDLELMFMNLATQMSPTQA